MPVSQQTVARSCRQVQLCRAEHRGMILTTLLPSEHQSMHAEGSIDLRDLSRCGLPATSGSCLIN